MFNSRIGAPFQAPEMSRGTAGAAPPADQFFIAAILYGLLTGQVPSGALSPVRTTRPDVPKRMAAATPITSTPSSARHCRHNRLIG